MGVQNLWILLAPVGRQIEIESLAGQVLAVDASIWLTQFVKAMRDDEGNMIRNAHLLGTLHRVSKLLFYGVRPVFVFDGQTPEIKKRTTARRRKRQEQQTANLRHTAQRILLNRLKQHRQELKKNGGAPAPAVEPGVTLPGASKDKNEDQETVGKEDESVESIADVTMGSERGDAEEMKKEEEEEKKDSERKELEGKEEEDVVLEIERCDTAEQESVTGPALLDKVNDKQNTRDDVFKGTEKRPLSKFAPGQAGYVPDSEASAVTAAWVARHQARVKQEPLLAIEKLRLDGLKKEIPSRTVNAASAVGLMQQPVRNVSVSLKLKDVDPEEMARFKKLFPVSVVEPAIDMPNDNDEDDDDVDWEEVATPAVNSYALPKDVAQTPTKQTKVAIKSAKSSTKTHVLGSNTEHDNGKSESDDEVDWEDVQDETTPNDLSNRVAVGSAASSREERSEKSSSPIADVQIINDEEKDDHLDGVEDTEELFLTLKNDMEDARAHEDLNLLKDEALLSAMATASNLTQWAAGAVRRALEAHTLQHGDEEDESKASPPVSVGAEVVVIDEKNNRRNDSTMGVEIDDNNEQLQAALAASIANGQEALEQEAGGPRVRYLQYTQPAESPSTGVDNVHQEMDANALRQEQIELKKLRNRQLRDTEGITDEMVAEVMALLQLFGVPFLVSPMEAEAQCAALEQLGLVDGVITDDSDIFPFGGQRVYKNIFHHQKFVEAFSARDIERELGFSREQVIALALLLGSDYTDGVRGIGIVNATEIAAAYPGIEGLREFKEWVHAFDVAEVAQRVASRKKKKTKGKDNGGSDEDGEDSDGESVRERFQRSHTSARRKWELGDEFPSKHVVQAYMRPQVDRSEARFSWSAPDLAALRNYCTNAFGWDQQKNDGVLQPLEEKEKAKATVASGSRHVQTRLDRFFTSYDDQVHYAQIKSKRLRSAVNQRTGSKSKTSKKQRK
ncbi:hypothetical protein JM16_007439 [Phytophthora kernoviae]|uniref:DNA repair protein n=1 Tax=Phytophthora kernoviae TaxID=325452 RepID=A0A8T0LRS3_9STRA|nr:hypothetical protein JM16_007439 [Phytophthora kernoviae]